MLEYPAMRELELLQHIYHANVSLPKAVSIPPGDDMAMIRIANNDVLATVDQLAGRREFQSEGQIRQRGHALLPELHERALPTHW